ncbi:hypothetical protein CCHOA_03105 [Corynebacterium choanae]|uniref:Uncharacterized protein n=1 Tax=Corynebacterium choanae TaxID=1862358 RepID=A0A3G6JAP3_9CORY|nr:hypothetical protein CCHOA_03105 [Corynebacterium choanae]
MATLSALRVPAITSCFHQVVGLMVRSFLRLPAGWGGAGGGGREQKKMCT